jgi:hypothetical protein
MNRRDGATESIDVLISNETGDWLMKVWGLLNK